MANLKVAVVNSSSVLSDDEVLPVVNALQRQVAEDFAPAWGIDADLTFVPHGQTPAPDAWWLVLADDSDQAAALGYHETTDAGKPLGYVFARTAAQDNVQWSITASHELLEMLADPEINLTVFVQSSAIAGTLYAYEVCDACEADQHGYEIDGVWVSDFVYPAWFESSQRPGSTQFDHTRHLDSPLPTLLPGGYIGSFEVGTGSGWRQVTAMHPARGMRNVVAARGSRRQRRLIGTSLWRSSEALTRPGGGTAAGGGRGSTPRRASLAAHQAHLEDVASERRTRIAAHHQAVRRSRSAAGAPPLNLFADGDSWFDYPLPPFSSVDVMTAVADSGRPTPMVLNLAHHGDEARQTLGLEKRQRLIDALTDRDNGTFDAILFSGGGNDIAGDQFCLWVKERQPGMSPSDGLDMARFRHVLGVIEAAYLELIAVRNKFAPSATIFIHSYDFAIPDARDVCDNVGPWLKPSLDFRGWTNLAEATVIVKTALLEFNALLSGIAQRSGNSVMLVPTQGTLSGVREWANELHPTPDGFRKIAAKFVAALGTKFPGRI